ncbi:MAG: hypothetical protein KF743_14330, partial [Fimbriimonadaceae bacterium]|nr:hypothetical protein [Fimbriimonadaceae bacterium]
TVRFRHYDPEIGRWLERDPAGYVDGMNKLLYVKGNAIRYVDPFALQACSKCDKGKRAWTYDRGQIGFSIYNGLENDPDKVDAINRDLELAADLIMKYWGLLNVPLAAEEALLECIKSTSSGVLEICGIEMPPTDVSGIAEQQVKALFSMIKKLLKQMEEYHGRYVWVRFDVIECECSWTGKCTWKKKQTRWYKCAMPDGELSLDGDRFLPGEVTSRRMEQCRTSTGKTAQQEIDKHNDALAKKKAKSK